MVLVLHNVLSGHKDPASLLLQVHQVHLLDPQVLNNPKDQVCHKHLALLLDHKDLLDLVLPLDHLALASLVLLKALLDRVALFHQDSHQDLQVLLPLPAHKLQVSLRFLVHLPALKTTLSLLKDQRSSEHLQVQLVLLDLANQSLLNLLLVLKIH